MVRLTLSLFVAAEHPAAAGAVDGAPARRSIRSNSGPRAGAAPADQQAVLARRVADALAIKAAPRDIVAQVGLLGATLPEDAIAVRAVTEVDAAAANGATDEISSTISAAHDAGMQRIAAVAVALAALLLIVAIAWFVLRPRYRRGIRGGAGVAALDSGAATLMDSVASTLGEGTPTEAPPPG